MGGASAPPVSVEIYMKKPSKAVGYIVVKPFFVRDGLQGVKGDSLDLPDAVASPLVASGHLKNV